MTSDAVDPRKAAVLTKATLRAAEGLELTTGELATVLGLPVTEVEQLKQGSRGIDPNSPEGQRAIELVRMLLALDVLVGGDERLRRAWFNSYNHALVGVPRGIILPAHGVGMVVGFLEAPPLQAAFRAKFA